MSPEKEEQKYKKTFAQLDRTETHNTRKKQYGLVDSDK